MLRILHTESSCGWGGQEIRILTESRGMIARGHEVLLLAPPESGIFQAAPRYGLPAQALPIRRKRPADLAAMTRWLSAHRDRFDVINTHSSTDSWLVGAARLWVRDAAPVVRTRHVSTPTAARATTRWLYARAASHVVTTGEALRVRLAQEQRLSLSHLSSVPTGIDLQAFMPRDARAARRDCGLEQAPTVGILATLRDWKGHAYLLDAWRRLQATHAQWRLLVIGDGPQRAALEARVDAEGLRASVRFVGNRDDVPRWLPALDIKALPSFGDEGVPQSILQAMACGLPVVSTPIGAIAEAVQDEVTGVLVPPRDADALAAALARLMDDAALRRRMGDAGRAMALERFGLDRMLDGMERVFRDVVAARRGGATTRGHAGRSG